MKNAGPASSNTRKFWQTPTAVLIAGCLMAQGFIGSLGWASALSMLALIVLSIVPLACLMPGSAVALKDEPAIEQGLAAALHEAFAHRGFVLSICRGPC